MRQIIDGKLYDSDKGKIITRFDIPSDEPDELSETFWVHETARGNIFAENISKKYLVDENMLKTILSIPDYADIYIKIFGEVEEA